MNSLKYLLFISLIGFAGCKKTIVNDCAKDDHVDPRDTLMFPNDSTGELEMGIFDRTEILENLIYKIETGDPLFVHVLVPLCDNEHQMIVPVSNSLGDGMNLRSNLYWGVSHGVRTVFKNDSKWKQVYHKKDADRNVLERLIYYRKFENNAKVYVTLDAYRGDRMKECLEDFHGALRGTVTDTVQSNNEIFNLYSKAQLLIFNGHNGMMENFVSEGYNEDLIVRDAVSISCSSQYYFNEYFVKNNAFPLVTTTCSLYPGGNIVHDLIPVWANLKSAEEIKDRAALSYHEMKNTGFETAQRMFNTGWGTKEF